jgi:uncharacterized delta-60 repeat protein
MHPILLILGRGERKPQQSQSSSNFSWQAMVRFRLPIVMTALVVSLGGAHRAAASGGSVDTSFDPGVGADGPVNAIAQDISGSSVRYLIGGSFSSFRGKSCRYVARVNIDGSIDTTFAPARINESVSAVAVQQNHKILIGGNFTSISQPPADAVVCNHIARFNEDGTLDTSFDTPSLTFGAGASVSKIRIDLDTTQLPTPRVFEAGILVAGGFNGGIVRLLPADGKLDPTFRPQTNSGADGTVWDVALDSKDNVVIVGDFAKYNGTSRARIARLNPDGVLDTTFNPGSGANGAVLGVAIHPDDKIVVVGRFTTINGLTRNRVARLNKDGSVDATFNPHNGPSGFISQVNAVALQGDGHILIGGLFTNYNDIAAYRIARLETNGQLDSSFHTGTGVSGKMGVIGPAVSAVLIDRHDFPVIAGDFTHVGGLSRRGLARLNKDDPPILLDTNLPANIEVSAGQTASFTVSVSGNSLSYNWRKDGVTIPGNYGSTLVVTQAAYNGLYSVHVQNTAGSVDSRAAQLKVVYKPGTIFPFPPGAQTTNQPIGTPTDAVCWDGTNAFAGNPSHDTSITLTWKDSSNKDLTTVAWVTHIEASNVELGHEIEPPEGADVSRLPSWGPYTDKSHKTYWYNAARKLYAVGQAPVNISWPATGGGIITNVPYNLIWPTNAALYQKCVVGCPPVDLTSSNTLPFSKLWDQDGGVGASENEIKSNHKYASTNTGRCLLMLGKIGPDGTSDPDLTNKFYFQFVTNILWNSKELIETNADIGTELTLGSGLHDRSLGGEYLYNYPHDRHCPDFYPDPISRTGTIIAVNRDSKTTTDDDMVLVGYQRGILSDTNGAPVKNDIGWPCKPVLFSCQWPTNAPQIVIASGNGTGPVDPQWSIYSQPKSNLPGYNPNEEHALKWPAQGNPPGLDLDVEEMSVVEGGSAAINVALTGILGTNVVYVTVSAARAGDTNLTYELQSHGTNVAEMIFTPEDYATAQTVLLHATPDSDSIDGTNLFTIRASGGLYDQRQVTVWGADTNHQGVVISKRKMIVPEGAENTFFVCLRQQPRAPVTVQIRPDATVDSALYVAYGEQLAFNASNWNTNQPVALGAHFDGKYEDTVSNLFYVVTSGGYSSTNVIIVSKKNTETPPDAVYALRDDLGEDPKMSEPYVLLKGRINGKPAIKVYRVVAENDTYKLHYEDAKAGRVIRPPYPLSELLNWETKSYATNSPAAWQDRKKMWWAKSAGSDGGSTSITMKFFYPVQREFDFPPGENYPESQLIPWLDRRPGGRKGIPTDYTYTVRWPDNIPELRIGETLTQPKFFLPPIQGQPSVEILYQQSLANGKGECVQLIDPTQTYWTRLDLLPGDTEGKTTVNLQNQFIFFAGLPPHLRSRFWYEPPPSSKLKFRGEFRSSFGQEEPTGYLLLNVITDRDKKYLLDTNVTSADSTFVSAVNNLAVQAAQVRIVGSNDLADSLALTAGLAKGTGYVTLAFNNATNRMLLKDRGTPVSIEIIKVTCPFYRGDLKVLFSDNPLDEKVTLRHTGDFAGKAGEYTFEWRYGPTRDTNSGWLSYANGSGLLDVQVTGDASMLLKDHWFMCRWGTTNNSLPCVTQPGTNWSEWTQPAYCDGWIKRVTSAINPFDQKLKDYSQNAPDTVVSMISQAGERWIGSVPFDLHALSNFGLLEIYETVLKRGIELSIDASPADTSASPALLGAARRIAELYMLLGNEAYADASDPTIGFGTEGQYGNVAAPTIHCFMDQTSSLLEEELALLRGLDGSFHRGTQLINTHEYPAYNRLRWNFTRNYTGGEVAYALNYNIRAQAGLTNIDAAAAQKMYPQGHGDAWGHYLTAIKNYYRLIRNPNFKWNSEVEYVTLGGIGQPVPVNYLDERKFAQIAAAKARTGAEIVNLTYRQQYIEDPRQQYHGYPDTTDPERAWGVSDWACRAGTGALFDWALANALLPAQSAGEGIQKVDRTTVMELREVAAAFTAIQDQLEMADSGLNPLGIGRNTVLFDINPNGMESSLAPTHFEQCYQRAVQAMNNAIAVFNYANNSTQKLRQQADSVTEFQRTVAEREADFNSRLIEVFGYPYSDDIGPGKTYPADAFGQYNGPDLYHFMYVDYSKLLGTPNPEGYEYQVPVVEYVTPITGQHITNFSGDMLVATNSALVRKTNYIQFCFAPNGFGLVKPNNWTGQRKAPGSIQMDQLKLLQAKGRFDRALFDYSNLLDQIEDQVNLLYAQYSINANEIHLLWQGAATAIDLNENIKNARGAQMWWQRGARLATDYAQAIAQAMPTTTGPLAFDTTSVLRGAALWTGSLISESLNYEADQQAAKELDAQNSKELAQTAQNIKVTSYHQELGVLQQEAQLEQLIRQEASARLELYNLQEDIQAAAGEYSAALAKGQRLIDDRTRFRQQTAEQTQSYRYRDMAFRVFRNEALQKYRAQFDLAAMYVYLAAKAYDFDTNLRTNAAGQPGNVFLNQIVRARTLGLIEGGQPVAGGDQDPGLADKLARMSDNYASLKGQLGLNYAAPSYREFSLRRELFRCLDGADGDEQWRANLTAARRANILTESDFKKYCVFLIGDTNPQPGLVIRFSSTILSGLNFFGNKADFGGSSTFNPQVFCQKLRSVGVTFSGYKISGAGALGGNPYVYLVPVGEDMLRSPPNNSSDNTDYFRSWRIIEQWLPVPFPISDITRVAASDWMPIYDVDTAGGNIHLDTMADIRRHTPFDAFHAFIVGRDQNSPEFKSASLIGRSVWNTQWLLVIPSIALWGDTSNPEEGLERFISGALNTATGKRNNNGVSDIIIRMEAYAYTRSP